MGMQTAHSEERAWGYGSYLQCLQKFRIRKEGQTEPDHTVSCDRRVNFCNKTGHLLVTQVEEHGQAVRWRPRAILRLRLRRVSGALGMQAHAPVAARAAAIADILDLPGRKMHLLMHALSEARNKMELV